MLIIAFSLSNSAETALAIVIIPVNDNMNNYYYYYYYYYKGLYYLISFYPA